VNYSSGKLTFDVHPWIDGSYVHFSSSIGLSLVFREIVALWG